MEKKEEKKKEGADFIAQKPVLKWAKDFPRAQKTMNFLSAEFLARLSAF